jgi:hypothetical protein
VCAVVRQLDGRYALRLPAKLARNNMDEARHDRICPAPGQTGGECLICLSCQPPAFSALTGGGTRVQGPSSCGGEGGTVREGRRVEGARTVKGCQYLP